MSLINFSGNQLHKQKMGKYLLKQKRQVDLPKTVSFPEISSGCAANMVGKTKKELSALGEAHEHMTIQEVRGHHVHETKPKAGWNLFKYPFLSMSSLSRKRTESLKIF